MCIYLLNKTHQKAKREKYVCSVLLVKCLHVQRKVIIDGYNRLRYLISANIYIYIVVASSFLFVTYSHMVLNV